MVWLGLVALSASWLVATAIYSWAVYDETLAGGLVGAAIFSVVFTVLAVFPALLVAGLWQAVATVRR